MRRGLQRAFGFGAVLVLAGLSACGQGGDQQSELEAAREAALTALESQEQALEAKREELAQLRASLEEPAEEAGKAEEAGESAGEGEAAEPMDPEAVQARVQELEREIEQQANQLGADLVAFINENPPVADEPLTEQQRRAVDIKIGEDILLAQEYIDEGGDYKRAISILEALAPLAPDDGRLAAELQKAQEMRFMTEERFAAVEEGMSEEEVRELLGPVNLRNLKEYPEKKITAWFYPRENGGAAGVYFEERRGQKQVYKADFNAVKPDSPGGEEG